MIKKILKVIKNPYLILTKLDKLNVIRLKDDLFLKIRFKSEMGYDLDLQNPKSFNEKLQWLKLNDRKEIYTTLVDKYEVKDYVKNIIGEKYIIPTLGIYDKFDDIDFSKLPSQFVIKCTHNSGGLVICKDKDNLNIKEAKRKIEKSLKENYYYLGREWPYKNVKPRIIIEQYISDPNNSSLADYKFYAFSGKCNYVMVCTERDTGHTKFYYFDRNMTLQKNMSKDGKQLTENKIDFVFPDNLEEMFTIVEKLSKDLKFVRIDLYNIAGNILFGEYTFYPSAGFDNTRTSECDKILTEQLNIK